MNPLEQIPLDQLTRNTDRALGILFLKDPVRTALGVVVGCALSSLNALFAMPWWRWLALGILIMHIRTIMQLLKKPSLGNYTIDMLFELIDRGNFSAAEKRQRYRQLIERFVELAAADYTAQKQEGAQTQRVLD